MGTIKFLGVNVPFFFALLGCPGALAQTDRGIELFQKGLSHYEKENYTAAMDYFTQALLHRPHDREIRKYVIATGQKIVTRDSRLQRMPLSELQQIVENAQRLLEQRRQEMKETLERLKLAYTQSQLQDPKSLLRACRGVDLLMEISLGDDPESNQIKQYLHSICKNLEKALEAGVVAIKADIHKILGYIAFCRSDWSKAIQEWGEALQLNPEDDRLRDLISKAGSRQQKEELARRIANFMQEATHQVESGMHKKAASSFEAVLKLDPTHEKALKLLETTQKRIREDARRAAIHENKILAIENQRGAKWIDAAQNWLNILELDPLHPEARKNLGTIKGKLSERVMGVTHPLTPPSLQREGPSNLEESQNFYTLGLLSYSEGNLEEAIENFKMSLQLNPLNEFAERALKRMQTELQYNP